MGFTEQDCPVCGQRDTTKGAALYDRDAVRFWCQSSCGTFAMGTWFLLHAWPTVSPEDKDAIAAYLKETKAIRDPRVILSEENYKFHVEEGKILLRQEASSLGVS